VAFLPNINNNKNNKISLRVLNFNKPLKNLIKKFKKSGFNYFKLAFFNLLLNFRRNFLYFLYFFKKKIYCIFLII
jgi:hypothetical protein